MVENLKKRPKKDNYYCDIADVVGEMSSCLSKHWGAVIVKDDTIISTGFNGAPRGVKDCYDKHYCRLAEYRIKNKLGRGEGYEQCLSVHAEMNAIIQASKEELEGSILYLCGREIVDMDGFWGFVNNPKPCVNCRKAIINAKIKEVVVKTNQNQSIHYIVDNWKNEEDIVGGY